MKKKALAAFLAVCMIVGMMVVPVTAASTFSDVNDSHWAASAIERWASYDVLVGPGDGTYQPEKVMTRAEFASMMVKMFDYTEMADVTFSDVAEDDWEYEFVSKLVAAGITYGYPDGTFLPDKPVSYNETAVMFCRGLNMLPEEEGEMWYSGAIDTLTGLGMMGEDVDEHLVASNVAEDCNRAIVAALADKIIEVYANEDLEQPITGEVKGAILVVKGAKVEIKDANLKAPVVAENKSTVTIKDSTVEAAIVANSSEVNLEGTTAKDVKVEGKDAKLTADADSSVEDVVMAGENPEIEVEGEIGSITVEKGTTGAKAEAPNVDPDKVTNNSTADATVNGEVKEGVPAEDTGDKTDDTTTATDDDDDDDTTAGDDEDEDTDPGHVGSMEGCGPTKWSITVKTVPATCTTNGSVTKECEVCHATKVVTVYAAQHSFYTKTGDADTGYTITKDSHGNPVYTGAAVAVNATYHQFTCTACNTKSEPVPHSFTDGVCDGCGYTKSAVTPGDDAVAHAGHPSGWHNWEAASYTIGSDSTDVTEESPLPAANCGKTMVVTYTCADTGVDGEDGCTATKVESILPSGRHTWAKADGAPEGATPNASTGWYVKSEANCKEYKVSERFCSVCELKETEKGTTLDSTKHKNQGAEDTFEKVATELAKSDGNGDVSSFTWVRKAGKVDPTCTTAGKTPEAVCASCGVHIAGGTAIAATGHTYEARDFDKTNPANYTKSATEHYLECGTCGAKDSKGPHTFRPNEGKTEAACTFCGKTCEHTTQGGTSGDAWSAYTKTGGITVANYTGELVDKTTYPNAEGYVGGKHARECKICHLTQTADCAGSWAITYENCANGGIHTLTCTTCSQTWVWRDRKGIAHEWKAATGTGKCEKCEAPHTAHEYDKTAEAPTGKCTICGLEHTHDWKDVPNEGKDPVNRKCDQCGKVEKIPTTSGKE